MISFYSYSFGCRVNEAEKQSFDAKLISLGYVYSNSHPDFIIINTCAVTQKAEREARQLIYSLKRKNPKSKIIITGCAATYWQKNKLYKVLPIDLIVENKQKEYLAEIIQKQFNCHCEERSDEAISNKYLNSGRLLIKIQDGCHRFCSYCIVPHLRGKPKSYPIKDIIQTINSNKQNIKEIILTAINTEAYGYDTGEKFTDLISEILDKTNIPRISFGSLHPLSITDEFLDVYRKQLLDNRIVDFFHIPLQSGSDKILKIMNRGYSVNDFAKIINKIYSINPEALIATDIIVGFFGEEKEDFEETYNLLIKLPIAKFHVFKFSKRSNTSALKLAKQYIETSEYDKKIRSLKLIALSNQKLYLFQKKFIGTCQKVFIIRRKKNGLYSGLIHNQIPVIVKSEKRLIKQDIYCKISDIKSLDLYSYYYGN